jgi:serine/threonine-protein kinase
MSGHRSRFRAIGPDRRAAVAQWTIEVQGRAAWGYAARRRAFCELVAFGAEGLHGGFASACPIPAGWATLGVPMLRRGHRVGKYTIRGRLAQGGFADVYRAHDTVEGIDVALKVPLPGSTSPGMLEAFRREVRTVARLEHPHILPLKNADTTDGRFIISYPLGTSSLDDRMARRLPVPLALSYGEQLLSALAYAHEQRVIHCDVKPENLILFGDGRLRLADFGLAKVAARTISASASGTIGFMAPEQALGRPSARSDVFSAGLVIYRMLTGALPEWPYDWPPPGHSRLRRIAPELGDVLERAIQVDARRRFRDAAQMLAAYRKGQRRVLRLAKRAAATAAAHAGRALAALAPVRRVPAAGGRAHARVPVVRRRAARARRAGIVPGPLPPLRARRQARLELVRVVSRSEDRPALGPSLHRPALRCRLRLVRGQADPVLALLPVVPRAGAQPLAAGQDGASLCPLRAAGAARVLGPLPVVRPGAAGARPLTSAATSQVLTGARAKRRARPGS